MKTTFTNTASDKDFMKTICEVLSSKNKPSIKISDQINEKLSDEDANEVEYGWDTYKPEHIQNSIDKVFNDKHRLEYDFKKENTVPHPDVEEHLNNHGYAITDYIGGKAKDKYNREVNIGKVLTKTNAGEQIKAAYDNDPERQKKSGDLKVVISHHPRDVAGMTSGHQSWVDQSCMNFKTGSNRDYLKSEVKQGTHVAYLTDKNDHDLDRPIARIAVKPFHNVEDEHDVIFRPENRTYGDSSSSFHRSVNNWFENKYPAKDGKTYYKNDKVYDDTGDKMYKNILPDEAEEHILSGSKIEGSIPPKTTNHVSHFLINSTISGKHPSVMNDFAFTQKKMAFDRNQTNALYKVAAEHGQKGMIEHLVRRGGDVLNKANLQHALDNGHDSSAVLKHRYLPDSYVDTLPTTELAGVHPSKIRPHHIDRVLDSYLNVESGSVYTLSDLSKHLTNTHLKTLIDHEIDRSEPSKISNWLKHTNATKELVDHTFNRIKEIPEGLKKERHMIFLNRGNKNPTPEHIAHTNTISGLNPILENANDALTHNLALHKAISIKNEPVTLDTTTNRSGKIILGGNSEKYVTDKEIPHIYDHLHYFETGTAMGSSVHDDLLYHSFDKIKEETEKYEDSGENDEESHDRLQRHFENHAEMITDLLADHRRDLRNDSPVNEEDLERLRDHIDNAQEHRQHEGTHDDVDSDHNDLTKEISNNW